MVSWTKTRKRNKMSAVFIRTEAEKFGTKEAMPLAPSSDGLGNKFGKRKNVGEQTGGGDFDRIFIDTPVSPSPPFVFPPVDSRRRNPEAENSPRFRGRIPRPASRGLRGATRLIGSNDGAGSRPRTGTLTFPTRSGVIARNQIAAANRCAVYNK